jgi:hypothetical protein
MTLSEVASLRVALEARLGDHPLVFTFAITVHVNSRTHETERSQCRIEDFIFCLKLFSLITIIYVLRMDKYGRNTDLCAYGCVFFLYLFKKGTLRQLAAGLSLVYTYIFHEVYCL